jgi:transketolase
MLRYTGAFEADTSVVVKHTLEELAQQDKDFIYFDSDLMAALGVGAFVSKYPGRFINAGIAEGNMAGVASGAALVGFKPYIHSFAAFVSRRAYDQIFLSAAYAQLESFHILACDPGITATFNGGTHMPFEDMAMMRAIPNIVVIDGTDAVMVSQLIRVTNYQKGIFYIRFGRKGIPDVYEKGETFEVGKAKILTEGNDVTIIASGIMVGQALEAADILATQGVNAEVIDPVTVKPLDETAILASARKTGAVVTAENHNVMGGLGSAVAELLSENMPTPMERIGAREKFGQVGTIDFLRAQFGMTAENIAKQSKVVIERKK